MTTMADRRVRKSQPAQQVLENPGFRRRHRMLAWVLALHLPALAGLAVLTGGAPQDLLVEAAIVVLALTAGTLLDLSPRLRAAALTVGLLGCAVTTGLLTTTLVWGLLHGGIVGLLAAAHLGASWRAPRAYADPEDTGTDESADASKAYPGTGEAHLGHPEVAMPQGQHELGVAADEVEAGYVEVREVYTGVWSAKHLVPHRTRLVRLPDPSPAEGTADPGSRETGGVAPGSDAGTEVDDGDVASTPTAPTAPPVVAETRDPNLTREVLEALHLSATDETVEAPRERVPSGQHR